MNGLSVDRERSGMLVVCSVPFRVSGHRPAEYETVTAPPTPSSLKEVAEKLPESLKDGDASCSEK